MATIKVQRKCAICEREHDISLYERDYGAYNGVLLSDVVFCEECRKRLRRFLYPEDLANQEATDEK